MSSTTEPGPGSPDNSSPWENPDAPTGSDAPDGVETTEVEGAATTQEFDPRNEGTAVRDVLNEWFSDSPDADDLETSPSIEGRPHAAQQRPTLRLSGFEVLGLIGRGGMGVVFKARQLSLNRVVALKILPPALAADEGRVRRFRNEATVASRLTHSRILPLYDVLDTGGAPVLVMPFVDGCDLERILADRRAVLKGKSAEGRHSTSTLAVRDYLEHILPLLDQAVEAVAVLHEAGIIHRDIKPSNLLVDRLGQVFLSDFGLSRLNEGMGLTLPNQGLGTPGYMAPEQWDGARDVDARADVFSLGTTLYKALTLEMPYGTSRIGSEMPCATRPSARVPGLSADFNTVILKALEPDRTQRYESGVALRDDWRRVRAGDEPLARPQSRIGRLVRRASKRPALTGAFIMILLLAGLLGWLQWRLRLAEALNPLRPRPIRVRTVPPGARVAVAPLDPVTGEPQLDRPTYSSWHDQSPAEVQLAPGDYFVEAVWDNGHFAQVFRHVPDQNEQLPMAYNHLFWKHNGGWIEVATIRDRELAGEPVRAGMTRFEGSERFVAPRDPATGATFSERRVLPFDLDDTEVTVAEFRRPQPGGKGPPIGVARLVEQLASRPHEAVRFVNFDQAVQYAEIRGKRLPTEAEYKFAFSNGGRTLYPQGDQERMASDVPSVGDVGLDPFDRLLDHPSVVGLHSNVAEWTTSRVSTFLPIPPNLRPSGGRAVVGPFGSVSSGARDRQYLVQGGLPSVAQGQTVPAEYDHSPYAAVRLPAEWAKEGVGLRCARSAEPYFFGTTGSARGRR